MINKYYPDATHGILDYFVGKQDSYFNNEYRRFYSDESQVVNKLTSPIAVGITAFEFYIPDNAIISSDVYTIDSIKLYFYVPYTPISTSGLFTNFGLYFRNESNYNNPQLQYSNNNSIQEALYSVSGVNYMSSLEVVPSGWNYILLSEDFTNKFLQHQSSNIISLNLKRTIESSNRLYLYTSAKNAGEYSPYLEVEYSTIESPAEIRSLTLKDGTITKYKNDVDLTIGVFDTESDLQNITIEARAYIGNNQSPSLWSSLEVTPSSITSSPEVTYTDLNVVTPFRDFSYATPEKFIYHTENTLTNGAIISGSYAVIPNNGQIYNLLITGRDLIESGVYVFGGSSNGILDYKVLINGSTIFNESLASGDYRTFNSGAITPEKEVELFIKNTSGTDKVLYSVNLTEQTFDINPWDVEIRALLTDNDGSGNYYYLEDTLQIDNRLPSSPVLYDNLGGQSEVFQENNTVQIMWNPSTIGGSGSINGYYYTINSNSEIHASGTDTFTTSGVINFTAPYDGKWYIHVSAESNNNVLSEPSVYSFFYNIPAEFNNASGFYINNTRIYEDVNTWIKHNLRPKISWSTIEQPQNIMTYNIQVGISGGIESYEIDPYDIDWDFIPSGNAMYFKLEIRDDAGIKYLEKDTKFSTSGWYIYDYDANNFSGEWIDCSIGQPNDQRYKQIKYIINNKDGIPDKIGMYASIRFGYFDNTSSAFVFGQPIQTKYFIFDSDLNAQGLLYKTVRTPELDKYLTSTINLSQDNYSTYQTVTTLNNPKSFTYIARHDPAIKIASYFESYPEDEDVEPALLRNDACNAISPVIEGVEGVGGFSVNAGRSNEYCIYFLEGDARLNFGNNFNPNRNNFFSSFWIKPSISSSGYVYYKYNNNNGFYFELLNNGTGLFHLQDDNFSTDISSDSFDLKDGNWHNIIINVDRKNSNILLYIDGELNNSETILATSGISNSYSFFIGGGGISGNIGNIKDVSLDDFLFGHRILTSGEISDLYTWNYNGPVFGQEAVLSNNGFIGDGLTKTFKAYAREANAIASGTYSIRYKFIEDNVSEPFVSGNIDLYNPSGILYEWNFIEPEIDLDGITANYYIPNVNLTYLNTTYFVRGRVNDGFEYGEWSNLFKFRINTIPSAPTDLYIN